MFWLPQHKLEIYLECLGGQETSIAVSDQEWSGRQALLELHRGGAESCSAGTTRPVFCYANGLMRLHKTLLLLIAVAVSAFAQDKTLPPVAERVAAQNALFEEQYESDLREFPERATSLGDYRYNDKLADRSGSSSSRRHPRHLFS